MNKLTRQRTETSRKGAEQRYMVLKTPLSDDSWVEEGIVRPSDSRNAETGPKHVLLLQPAHDILVEGLKALHQLSRVVAFKGLGILRPLTRRSL